MLLHRVLGYMPGLSNLYAFSCLPGASDWPRHVAAALWLCSTLLHVQSIWTLPPIKAFPEWAWVCFRRRMELGRGCQFPDELVSVSSAACSVQLASCSLAAAIDWHYKPSLPLGSVSLSPVIWFSPMKDSWYWSCKGPPCAFYMPWVEQAQLVSCDKTGAGRGFISLLCSVHWNEPTQLTARFTQPCCFNTPHKCWRM